MSGSMPGGRSSQGLHENRIFKIGTLSVFDT